MCAPYTYVVGNLKEIKSDTPNETVVVAAGIHDTHNVHICVCTSKIHVLLRAGRGFKNLQSVSCPSTHHIHL